jgi:HK97 gp10 family phage protein
VSLLKVDLSSLNAMFDRLGADVEASARPAAQAAAQVIYDEVKRNVSALGQKSGNLKRSIYQVYSRKHSGPGLATYHISYNAQIAPHGHLLEFGYIQRYRMYQSNDGKIRPMVQPGMEGRRKPGRRASRAEKNAYYVLRATPLQVAAHPFLRSAMSRAPQALAAAEQVFLKAINEP